jgi:hypothetical protein
LGTHNIQLNTLLIPSPKISHFMTSFIQLKPNALSRLSTWVSVMEIVRCEDNRGGGRVHKRIRDVARGWDVMGAEIEEYYSGKVISLLDFDLRCSWWTGYDMEA